MHVIFHFLMRCVFEFHYDNHDDDHACFIFWAYLVSLCRSTNNHSDFAPFCELLLRLFSSDGGGRRRPVLHEHSETRRRTNLSRLYGAFQGAQGAAVPSLLLQDVHR